MRARSCIYAAAVALAASSASAGSESAALRRMGVRLDYERYFNSLNYSANFLTTKLTYRF